MQRKHRLSEMPPLLNAHPPGLYPSQAPAKAGIFWEGPICERGCKPQVHDRHPPRDGKSSFNTPNPAFFPYLCPAGPLCRCRPLAGGGKSGQHRAPRKLTT